MSDVTRLLAVRCRLFNTPTLLLVVSLVLAAASPSRGEVGAIVLEPVGALGFFTRVGRLLSYPGIDEIHLPAGVDVRSGDSARSPVRRGRDRKDRDRSGWSS